VALSLARQRLLTAKFDFYKMRPVNSDDLRRNPFGPWLLGADGKPSTFICKTVPHITLKSIAQNVALDSIFLKHQPVLDAKLAALNAALKKLTPAVRTRLATKLAEKRKHEGNKSVTDADRRRWLLPKDEWKEWEVPFDTDDEWPEALQTALTEYRVVWRAKMDEVNACIKANAEQEELADDPDKDNSVVRVSGPFTMEAVMPAEESLGAESPIGGEPEELETFGSKSLTTTTGTVAPPAPEQEPQNAEAYLDKILRLLKSDGVRFPNNKVAAFTRLEAVSSGDFVHAEGDWNAGNGKERRVAVSFGPQFGPVTAYQVENALHHASRRGFDDLVFAGFSFDGSAQAIIQDDPNPKVRCHLAHIRPDVTMSDLLKDAPNSQIFTVFGSVRPLKVTTTEDGQYIVEMEGVDIYNPVENTIHPTNADKVAAWFLDGDYDGRTFCITQAFFPDKSAWEKLAKALKGVIDEDRFEALSGTVSMPFPVGKHKRCAVKVIDPRGNEVMRVHRWDGKY
jgi:adenine-specific DNA-methyltransferase